MQYNDSRTKPIIPIVSPRWVDQVVGRMRVGLAEQLSKGSPIVKRVLRGALWSLVGVLVSRGLGLLANIFVVRLLGKQGFGEFGIIQSTIGTFGTFAGFGLGLTATKYLAEYRKEAPIRAGKVLTLSTVTAWMTGGAAAIALCLCAPWLAGSALAAPELCFQLRIASILVFLGAINGAQMGALSGFEAFRRIANVNLWGGLASFPCLVLGSSLLGVRGAVIGLTVAQAFLCIITWRAVVCEALEAGVPLWPPNWVSEAGALWNVSVPGVLASLLVTPSMLFAQSSLAKSPSGYQGLAEFCVGAQWRSLLQYVPLLLCAAYLPVASSIEGNRVQLSRRLMLGNVALSGVVTSGAALVILFASPWILAAYGPGYVEGKFVFILMIGTAIADSINSVFMQSLVAAGRTWYRLLSSVVWAAIFIAFAGWLIPSYCQLGLAMAVCCAQWLHLCFQAPLALRAVERISR